MLEPEDTSQSCSQIAATSGSPSTPAPKAKTSKVKAKVKAKAEAAAAETPDMENIMSGENLGTLLALTSGERAEVALSDDDQPIEQAAKRARTAEEPSNGAGFTEEEAGTTSEHASKPAGRAFGNWPSLPWRRWLQHCGQKLRGQPRDPCLEARVAATFHAALCGLLVVGAKMFLLVLLFRLIIFQLYLESNLQHLLSPSLDVSSVVAYATNLFICSFRRAVTPNTLDAWYVVNQAVCILPVILCPSSADLASVSLITLLPRFLVGLCPKHAGLVVLGNLVYYFLALSHTGFRIDSNFASQSAELGIILAGALAVRFQIFANVRVGLDLKTRKIELEAVSALLLGFCDAVVEVDVKTMQLTEDSHQLSTMLLHGHGMTAGGLAGRDFLHFFVEEDRSRIVDSLSMGSANTLALNARLLDCLGNTVRVELLHVQFSNLDGQACRLVGMREFQDTGATFTAPMGPTTGETSNCTVLFSANSFDIFSVSEGFQQLCSRMGQSLNLDGMSVFDLSKTTGPDSFSRQLQDVINSDEHQGNLAKVDLMGVLSVDAIVTLQKDVVLQDLVGTLLVTHVHGNLTESNVARLGGLPKTSRGRSKSSRSSRSSRSGQQQRQGSILKLRGVSL
ncbi:unnamed protein product [Effrenium voratum]|nr:unnamed protein product [Effrenium voratum]